MRRIVTTVASSLLAATAMTSAALADDKPPPTFSISGYVDGGITGNLTGSTAGTNFGHLFDDRANQLMLNQASILFTKPLDPNATGLDFGFTFQPMYGSDARYTHLIGLFDRSSIAGPVTEAEGDRFDRALRDLYIACDEAVGPAEAERLVQELHAFPEVPLKAYNDGPAILAHIQETLELSRRQWRESEGGG